MIGDYVIFDPNVFNNNEDEYEPTKEPYPCKIESGEQIDKAVNGCYSPIPLTAEILEKNGLKNYEEYPEYKIKTNEYEIWVILDEPQNCVHVEKFDKSIPTIYHSKISFVHDLQHALRLCGVDKEIVL